MIKVMVIFFDSRVKACLIEGLNGLFNVFNEMCFTYIKNFGY